MRTRHSCGLIDHDTPKNQDQDPPASHIVGLVVCHAHGNPPRGLIESAGHDGPMTRVSVERHCSYSCDQLVANNGTACLWHHQPLYAQDSGSAYRAHQWPCCQPHMLNRVEGWAEHPVASKVRDSRGNCTHNKT